MIPDGHAGIKISIHALREEGDPPYCSGGSKESQFLSTPSARRATPRGAHAGLYGSISIHALREEGDLASLPLLQIQTYFYPRPPRGGRRVSHVRGADQINFYPRPPRGGRRSTTRRQSPGC